MSKNLHRPKNRLINEAVEFYVRQKSRELELTLQANLEELRACRMRDPDFEQSIKAVVDAEAQLGGGDPAEGEVVHPGENSARKKIQSVLDGA